MWYPQQVVLITHYQSCGNHYQSGEPTTSQAAPNTGQVRIATSPLGLDVYPLGYTFTIQYFTVPVLQDSLQVVL
jgi:hypothetical protein